MGIKKVAAALVATGLAIGLAPLPAHATNFGATPCTGSPRNCVNKTWHASGAHGVCIKPSVGAAMDIELRWQFDWNYISSSTHVEMFRECSFPSQELDVWGTNATWASFWAWNDCQPSRSSGSGASRRCSTADLWLNNAWLNFSTGDADVLAAYACHELGHSVGLRHVGGSSCVQDPTIPGLWLTTAHDNAHLMGAYS
jgi:hypothetical protein